ncbi:MAG: putative toxin-antitoxin system toxin component, PIN family [Anaerolineaceae bacterium]|nr:putative toxin-antitoxin system toxin component, PIN family [Anaerolineaceae bacterium]
MKVMIDTNIIISAALFPKGKAAQALYKAMSSPFEPILCDYVIDELHRKFLEKFPTKRIELEAFLFNLVSALTIVTTPIETKEEEMKIRDPKDRPILRSAIEEHADLFLTGDKDFLESSVSDPRIISVPEFLQLNL